MFLNDDNYFFSLAIIKNFYFSLKYILYNTDNIALYYWM